MTGRIEELLEQIKAKGPQVLRPDPPENAWDCETLEQFEFWAMEHERYPNAKEWAMLHDKRDHYYLWVIKNGRHPTEEERSMISEDWKRQVSIQTPENRGSFTMELQMMSKHST